MSNSQNMLKSCRLGDLATLESLLESCPSLLNSSDNKLGWSGLYCSVICGQNHITKFLLQKNADVNIKNRMGETPLHQAVDSKDLKITKLLIKYKADPNSQQNDGETPLHIAVYKSHTKIVKVLLKNKADPNIPNVIYGKSPTHYAFEIGNSKILEEILKYQPNTSLKDKLGNTPIDLSKTLNTTDSSKCRFIASPDHTDLTCLTQQLSPSYTRCNSDFTVFTDTKSFDSKFKQIEIMHKKIRETVKSSVDTFRKIDSSVEIDSKKTQSFISVSKKPEFYNWLKSIKLASDYEKLVNAGYDDIQQLIKQMNSNFPITENMLEKIGIKKVANRRKFLAGLIKLGEGNNNENFFTQIKCCVLPAGVWGKDENDLEAWLEDLNLKEFLPKFKENGFNEVEDFNFLIGTKWEIDENALVEIGIDKPGYRHRILSKMKEAFHERRSEGLLLEKNEKNEACSMCSII